MSSVIRTGMSVIAKATIHMCKVLTTYRPAINAVIAAAVVAGTIDTSQEAVVQAWLGGAQAACDILKLITGY